MMWSPTAICKTAFPITFNVSPFTPLNECSGSCSFGLSAGGILFQTSRLMKVMEAPVSTKNHTFCCCTRPKTYMVSEVDTLESRPPTTLLLLSETFLSMVALSVNKFKSSIVGAEHRAPSSALAGLTALYCPVLLPQFSSELVYCRPLVGYVARLHWQILVWFHLQWVLLRSLLCCDPSFFAGHCNHVHIFYGNILGKFHLVDPHSVGTFHWSL